jgi:hypothetical protein
VPAAIEKAKQLLQLSLIDLVTAQDSVDVVSYRHSKKSPPKKMN